MTNEIDAIRGRLEKRAKHVVGCENGICWITCDYNLASTAIAALDADAKIIAEQRGEIERLRKTAHSACFHYWNCENDCHKAKSAMAYLATESGYTDPAVNDEINDAIARASLSEPEKT